MRYHGNKICPNSVNLYGWIPFCQFQSGKLLTEHRPLFILGLTAEEWTSLTLCQHPASVFVYTTIRV